MFIGFAGKAGSGKSTCAKEGVINFGGTILSFAQPLKEICSILLGCSVDAFESQEFKKKQLPEIWQDCIGENATYRTMLQTIGTDLFRNGISKNFWVTANHKRMQTALRYNTNVFVPDVRFNEEVDYIHKYGGKVILLNRNLELPSEHESENVANLNNIDYVIDNSDSNLLKLKKDIVSLLKDINDAQKL